jgi:signal transduction histidine kinase
VPLTKDQTAVGLFTLYRQEVRPFTDKQIALLENFAAQAVIAMENARLLTEQREALELQRASADILSVISHSVAEAQPAFEEILRSIARLFGSDENYILLVDDDDLLHIGAGSGPRVAQARALFPVPLDQTVTQTAIRERRLVNSADVFNDSALPAAARERYRALGENYAMVVAPMLREDRAIGSILVARRSMEAFSAKDCSLLQTFADQAVIAIQNARMFEQVQAKTRELSASLDELRTAQDRLVQTEKLASLGQLTAGIAHEIKNPLNFVNNFSALSAELVDELDETLIAAPLDDKQRGDIAELTQLLKSNLEKVVQHGQRADSIVKNMLQHSRSGASEHRPVDLNALAEEALNLAYHGARAANPSFNITLEKSLDPAAGKVDLFAQEFTRVLLNLVGNGFYAAHKRAEAEPGHAPILRLSTRDLGDQVEIRVRDNGTGMSPAVREKIFEPFFTTKPAGEGTGLGLSLSYDIIVKQHGGRLAVASAVDDFTEFVITLPRATASGQGKQA